jgi:hypothetical protein
MAMAKTKEAGQALERVRPQERALVQAASELGILREAGGALMIDLSSPQLAENYNVLAPAATLVQADRNFTPSISVVNLDSSPAGGDFYEIEKPKAASGNYAAKPGAYALSKRALDVIGKQAGIEDLAPEIHYFGARDQNVRVTWHCRVRRPDGTYQTASGTREWIGEDEKAQLEGSIPDWATKGESARAKWWNDNWYGRVKRFRLPMTESKARLRAYRQVLTLKSKYSADEIARPFLVVSTTFTPDTSDPNILRMLFTGGEQATGLLYGPKALPAETEPIDVDATEHEEPPAGVDPGTGEILPDEPETFGERPETDPKIPSGEHKGRLISEVARERPDYVRETLLASGSAKWGTAAEAWLKYWGHAVGGDDDDVQF